MNNPVLLQPVPDYLICMSVALQAWQRQIQKCHGCFLKCYRKTPRFWGKSGHCGLCASTSKYDGRLLFTEFGLLVDSNTIDIERGKSVWMSTDLVRRKVLELLSIAWLHQKWHSVLPKAEATPLLHLSWNVSNQELVSQGLKIGFADNASEAFQLTITFQILHWIRRKDYGKLRLWLSTNCLTWMALVIWNQKILLSILNKEPMMSAGRR